MWRSLGVSLLLFLSTCLTRADVLYCAVCKERIIQVFVSVELRSAEGKIKVCEKCAELPRCSTCGIPIRENGTTLTDGRVICQPDMARTVNGQHDSEAAFREAKRDAMAILAGSGVLPDRNITLTVTDRKELNRIFTPKGGGHGTMGITSSQLVGNDAWEHSIYILDHLSVDRFTAIAAHEYGHAWIAENVRKGRALLRAKKVGDPDSVEGFCEWIAYKVVDARNLEVEKKLILDNAYTGEQVHAFIKADQQARSYDVIKWIKEGTDQWVDIDAPNKILNLDKGPAASGPLWVSTAKTVVPSTLILRGISGSASRRFALINDMTLQKNETGRVRVGQSNVVVQCLSISSNSVLIKIVGNDKPTELYLTSSH
jgi:hypothetical protein